MKVTYVGRQKPHRERLYGTRTVFDGPGDTQEIGDDAIARKMINNHPDQYAECVESDLSDENKQSLDSDQTLEEALLAEKAEAEAKEKAEKAEAEAKEKAEKEAAEANANSGDGGETKEGVILLGGQEVSLEAVSKDVLIDTAKRAYGSEISARMNKPEVVKIVAGLITERGQPKGL